MDDKPGDPHHRLLEKAGVVKLGKSKGQAVPVALTPKGDIAEDYRQCGIGGTLLAKAEDWARNHKCVEMASDALVDNELSQREHEALGYEVVDRCVHYRKRTLRNGLAPQLRSVFE